MKLFQGKLFLVGRTELHIFVQFSSIPVLLQLDTGAAHTQISTQLAKSLKLKSHPKLIETTRLRNGSLKFDYLSVASVTLNGIQSLFVVKIAPNQPNLLGLDAIMRFNLVIDPVRETFTQRPSPIQDLEASFNFTDFRDYMMKHRIQNEDLVPIEDLPDPTASYIEKLKVDAASSVIDLGTT